MRNPGQALTPGGQEFKAQAGTLLFVPQRGLFHIAFGRTQEYDIHFSS